MQNTFTLGADPEFFLQRNYSSDSRRRPKIVSAENIIPGTKYSPFVLDDGTVIHRDNIMLEINPEPVEINPMDPGTIEDLKYGFLSVFKNTRKYLIEAHNGEISISSRTTTRISTEMETDIAKEFGCEPDMDAWNIDDTLTPEKMGKTRCAGGHIHIGGIREKVEDPGALVRSLDLTLGLWSAQVDPDKVRRKFYGQAGRYRITSYGVEYRTPSNFWCSFIGASSYAASQRLNNNLTTICRIISWTLPRFDLADTVIENYETVEAVKKAIKTGDKALARDLQVALIGKVWN